MQVNSIPLKTADRMTTPGFPLSPSAQRRYDAHFKALAGTDSTLKLAQARPLFDRAGVDDALLQRILAIAAPGHRGVLDRQSFSACMHLATRALQGHPLPTATESRDVWSLSHDDASKYDGYFDLLDVNGAGRVSRAQADPLFDRAELPAHSISLVWALSDVDSDGLLSRSEFRVAMHLCTHAVQGRPLPSRLPPELERRTSALLLRDLTGRDGIATQPAVLGHTVAPEHFRLRAHASVARECEIRRI